MSADGLVYHALTRGNNRDRVFSGPDDFKAFLDALAETKERYPFRLFCYCLMSNHFHLILQPSKGQNISRIVRSLTVAHSWRFHKQHRSSGHVWQGRLKSPVIAEDDHLLTVMRYFEAKPLRARMVTDLAAYLWSSYLVHGVGKSYNLVEEAPVWERLGKLEAARQRSWRKRVHTPLPETELAAVRRAVTTGRPYGNESWVERMATRLGVPLTPRLRGGPRKEIK